MIDKKEFGQFIKAKRQEKGYSQKELAERLFLTESAVSKWERGITYPDVTLLADICAALDVSEHELITASADGSARREKREAWLFRCMSKSWFWIPTIGYGIALITCFICNLAVQHTLSWFFVVLASIVCAYAFVPTYTRFFRYGKGIAFAGTSLATLCLLYFTCGLYTNTLYWVPTACCGTLLGYVVLFVPLLLKWYPLPQLLKRCAFVITAAASLLITIALLALIRVYQPFALIKAVLLTLYCFVPLLAGTIICALPINVWVRAAFTTIESGIFIYGIGAVVEGFYPTTTNYYWVDFTNWSQCVNGNVQLLILLCALLIGGGLLVVGYRRRHR